MSLVLFKEYASNHDVELRNLLVKQNHNLARKQAHIMAAICSEPYEDLEQEAVLGLIRSVENFNPNKGVAFSSYAVPYIHGKLLQYLRDKGHLIRLSQSTQTLINRGQKKIRELTQELKRTPTSSEVANSLNVPLEKYELAIKATQGLVAIDEDNENMIYFPATEPNEQNDSVVQIDWSNLSEGELAILRRKKSDRRKVWAYLANATTQTR